MARPIEKSIEYYPMNCNFLNDIKIRRIIKACGASSIAILLHLLGNIYGDEGYYMQWNEDVSFLISDSLGVNEGLVNEVIKKAIQVDFFDEHLFNEFKILSSKGIQNRYLKATEKRKNEHLNNDYLLVNTDLTIVSSEKTTVNDTETPVNVSVSTQSKVKESKVNKSKENNKENSVSLNKNIAEIAKLYENCGFGTINLSVKETLVDFSKQFSMEWIREAFKIASDNNKHNLAYVNGILENWRSRGKSNNSTKKTKFHNFKQLSDDYSEEELDDLFRKKRSAFLETMGD